MPRLTKDRVHHTGRYLGWDSHTHTVEVYGGAWQCD